MAMQALDLKTFKANERNFYALVNELLQIWPGEDIMIGINYWKMLHHKDPHTKYIVWDGTDNHNFKNAEEFCTWWNTIAEGKENPSNH